MGQYKERKTISINMECEDIKRLDGLCDFLTQDFGFAVSRTKAINFLVKRYYWDVIGDKFGLEDTLTENQLENPTNYLM